MGFKRENKKAISWYKSVMGCSMFYKGMAVLRLVSFPSKNLGEEQGVEGFQCGCGIPTLASKRATHVPLSS